MTEINHAFLATGRSMMANQTIFYTDFEGFILGLEEYKLLKNWIKLLCSKKKGHMTIGIRKRFAIGLSHDKLQKLLTIILSLILT